MSLKNIFLLTILMFFSCCGEFEKSKLLKYSHENESYKIEFSEKDFNERDSLLYEKKYTKVFDNKNRIINLNNNVFYFYDDFNKLTQTKSIYRRGRITRILTYNYIYNQHHDLAYTTFKINEIDTIKFYKYDKEFNLVEFGNNYFKTQYKYLNNKIIQEKEFDNNELLEISNFIYDKKGNKIINNWIFNKNQKMITYYTYDLKNRLSTERDSSITTFGNPNEVVESLTKYMYDKKDSLIEKRSFSRILSEREFKYEGKTTFEYKKFK